jgi:hypothetical protein
MRVTHLDVVDCVRADGRSSRAAAKRSAEWRSPRAPAAASGGGLGAEPPSTQFVQGARGQRRVFFFGAWTRNFRSGR